MKKAQSLLYHLKDNPLRYTEMQQFLWSLSKDDKCNRGYWCTNIFQLIRVTKVIKKGTDNKYRLTKIGLKNIDNPFSKDVNYWKERALRGERNRGRWYRKYADLQHKVSSFCTDVEKSL